jgi:CRISPR-associated protein Csd1
VIVQSLVRYYDILAADDKVKIAKTGCSPANVSFILVIADTGELTNIMDIRIDGKKKRPRVLFVPYQESRQSGIHPFFLCDKAQYVFGVERVEIDRKTKSGMKDVLNVLEETETERIVISKRSLDAHKQFCEFHHSLLDSVKDPAVHYFLKFLDSWNPEKSLQHKKFAEFKEDLLNGGLIVFECRGECLHKNATVKTAWEHNLATVVSEETKEMQCLVSGKIEPVSRVHKWIKGVKGTQAQGAPLISFNNDCFCSYGRDQSYNSPVSATAMFKYTTVLNHLLEWESKNKIQIGDTTIVFWAETDKKICENLVLPLLDPVDEEDETNDDLQTTTRQQDRGTRQFVNDILQKVRSGRYLEERDLGVDPNTTNFYILGLSPNQGRLVVRFWQQDTFGNFITRLARHHLDMEIERDDRVPRFISTKWLLRMTVPEKSDDKAISPSLGGLLMRSILDGSPYPIPMYNAIVNRAKVERSINYARAGFIKACLIRMARARKENEEEITVSLNVESQNVPYRLGRLFAVLEKTQSDTNKDLKSTINSKYFASASTTPGIVFPVLLKLAQHHIAKSDWGFKSEQSIQDILNGIDDEFPSFLSLEDQGKFMLGYYHQRKAFFKKKEGNKEKTEVKK